MHKTPFDCVVAPLYSVAILRELAGGTARHTTRWLRLRTLHSVIIRPIHVTAGDPRANGIRDAYLVVTLPLRRPPGGSDAIADWPAWRFALSRRFFSHSNAIGMEAHILFRKSKRTPFLTLAAIQNSPAQQRQLLEPNAILPRQGQIRPNCERRARPVCRDAFKRENSKTLDLAESFQNELRFRVLHGSLLPVLGRTKPARSSMS